MSTILYTQSSEGIGYHAWFSQKQKDLCKNKKNISRIHFDIKDNKIETTEISKNKNHKSRWDDSIYKGIVKFVK
tara:strand:+ start:281 stop:502 length:222 start_codon:yes stop_codon:yes gene_type:complete